MNDWMWYLTRSTGIVATVLAVASLLWGLFFSARNTGTRLKANWWLALHNRLGALTLVFIVAHMAAAFADSDIGLGLVALFVPRPSDGWPIAWGVIGFWLFVVVVATSAARVRRRLPRRWWHAIHLVSIPAVAVGAVHGYQTGTDMRTGAFALVLAALAGVGVYPVMVRLLGLAGRRA